MVCRQLNLYEGKAVPCCEHTPAAPDRIWLDQVQCTGYERRLDACNTTGFGHGACDSGRAVGVRCDLVPPPEGMIKKTLLYTE